jgi:hypothetical protein
MNDTDTYQLWPLVVVIIDGYDPHTAPAVVEALAGVDEEVIAAMWACHGYAAQQDAQGRRN